MKSLVLLMLYAGGPEVLPARISWPLHKALRELDEQARRSNMRRDLPVMEFNADPDVQLRAGGADRATEELLRAGVLEPEGVGRDAVIRVNRAALVAAAQPEFMRLAPHVAQLVRQAAIRWAALVSTSEKNRSTGRGSAASTVASSTPKRRQPPPGTLSVATSRR
jgi:hypothetical protein